jgi:amino acid transporter
MSIKTYARLSLLIPFLVWGVCLLSSLVASLPAVGDLIAAESSPILDWIERAIVFYAIGIIIWIFPYILLGLILLSLTFIREPRVLIKVFSLSPIAMVILTLGLTMIVAFWDPWESAFTSNPYSNLQDFTSFSILLVVFILIWSYICVGIGFGIYKLLQYLEIIKKEETSLASRPIIATGSE